MRNNQDIISVVIPNYNGRHLLATCLDSVLAQKKVRFEVILVDDCSTDGSAEFVRENYPGVEVIRNEENIGFSKSINIGIMNASGSFIATLNNDTEVEQDWLFELYQALEQEPQAAIAASKMLFFNQRDTIDTAGDAFTNAGFAYKRGYKQSASENFNVKEFVFSACAGAAMFRFELFERIGYFDEDFFAFNEDVDLCFRAQLAGFKCIYVPTAIVYHIVRATFRDDVSVPIYLGYRNQVWTIVKNMPGRLILRYLHNIMLHQLIALIFCTLKGNFSSIIKAQYHAIKGMPKFLEKRRAIQQNRVVSDKYLMSIIDRHWILSMTRLSTVFRWIGGKINGFLQAHQANQTDK